MTFRNMELDFPGTVKEGDEGFAVRRVQEWLVLHGQRVAIDGEFGPATRAAVVACFPQGDRDALVPRGSMADGVVNDVAWGRLTEPMRRAVERSATLDILAASGSEPSPRPSSHTAALWSRTVLAVAKRHLWQRPREVGGANRGPWVRLYMDGREGKPWPWCAGFVGFVLRQAKRDYQGGPELGTPDIGPRTFSCDVLADNYGTLRIAPPAEFVQAHVKPGDLFFVGGRRDFTHVGLVTAVLEGGRAVRTVEGNTNDQGDREGYEVCERVRATAPLSFARTFIPADGAAWGEA